MKRDIWLNLIKVLFFGGLSYFLGEIQLFIPGIEGGIIDFREIILLIGVFYFPHWIYLTVIILITSLGIPPGPMQYILVTMHIISIIPVFYFQKLVSSHIKSVYIQGALYFITVLAYYYVFMYPTEAILKLITGLNKESGIFDLYKASAYSLSVESFSSAFIPSLILMIHRFRKILQQQNQELVSAKNKAEESDKLKTAFLNNLSHEIRTPLNGIVGFAGLICEEGYSKKETNQFRTYIQENTTQLLKLIDKIINISRFDAEDTKLDYIWSDPKKIIEDTLNSIAEDSLYSKTKDIDLITSIDQKLDNTLIYSNQAGIQEIIFNLVHNALKHTNKGEINLSVTRNKEKRLFIEVTDTGSGIAEIEKEKIFNRFYKGESIDTTIRGIGLGLSITKKLVEILKGKIWFESTVNVGTKFYVELPVKFKTNIGENDIQDIPSINSNTNNNEINILVAEDDDTNFFYIEEILKKENYTTHRVTNGYEAVETMQEQNSFQLVLMDIKMPLLDGISATKLIRDFNKEVPIIALTAYSMENDKMNVISAGCNDYLTKPINRNKLIPLLKEYL